jgi:hypothetical protein
MPFIQTIEFTSTRLDELEALMEEWKERTDGRRTARRAVLAADRERPNVYVQIVEFDSYDEAMENSSLAETSEFAERIVRLCDGPPQFRNLEVHRVDDLS